MILISRTQWGARSPDYRNIAALSAPSTGHWNGPTVTVNGQPTWSHDKCAGLVRGIQNFHMDSRGWSDIAYNFLVCPHGYVFEGRGLNVINGANGINAANQSSHAICMLAGEGNDFPDAEKQAFRDCVRYISAHTKAPDACVGHRDHKSTACPGDVRYNWIHQGMPIGTQPTSDQDEDDDMKHYRPILDPSHPDHGKTFVVSGDIRLHVPGQTHAQRLAEQGLPPQEIDGYYWDMVRGSTFDGPQEKVSTIASVTATSVVNILGSTDGEVPASAEIQRAVREVVVEQLGPIFELPGESD